MTKAATLTVDTGDLCISLLIQVLGIPASKLAVTRKKDVALPSATLPNGAKLSGVVSIAKMVLNTAEAHAEWAGSDAAEKVSVDAGMEQALAFSKSISGDVHATLKTLDETLRTRVFIATNHLTLADFFYYAALYTTVAKTNKQTRSELCNITRYFNLIQHLAHESGRVTLTDIVDIDLDVPSEDIPLVAEARKVGGPGNKEGNETKRGAVPAVDKKGMKEEKNDGKKGGETKKVAAPQEKTIKVVAPAAADKKTEKVEPVEENLQAEPERLDLRVGRITKVEKHPQADTLFVEEVDLGEDKPRTVVSGLVKYMKAEDLENRLVVLLCNLKPAKMRGIESQAMVLAATSVDGTTVELLDAPKGSTPGDRCWFDTHKGSDFSQLNAKKKTWETVQPRLKTDASKRAVYSVVENAVTFNFVLRNEHGEVTVKNNAGASIK
ncbi:hypothetical protein BC830DRAFT_238885 [Chytriomyces sp. MP71]|nr:hypothetical protein BC830DRAFT_238885 [Chytriomyces sp. MP71]